MVAILSHPVFARLFAAQIVALLGTGLMTVALGLLAYDIAGAQAGAVLGVLAAAGVVAAHRFRPAAEPDALPHEHPDLPPDHPHLRTRHGEAHAHPVVIDALHRAWPTQG